MDGVDRENQEGIQTPIDGGEAIVTFEKCEKLITEMDKLKLKMLVSLFEAKKVHWTSEEEVKLKLAVFTNQRNATQLVSRGRPPSRDIQNNVNNKRGLKEKPIVGLLDFKHDIVKMKPNADVICALSRVTNHVRGSSYELSRLIISYDLKKDGVIAPIWDHDVSICVKLKPIVVKDLRRKCKVSISNEGCLINNVQYYVVEDMSEGDDTGYTQQLVEDGCLKLKEKKYTSMDDGNQVDAVTQMDTEVEAVGQISGDDAVVQGLKLNTIFAATVSDEDEENINPNDKGLYSDSEIGRSEMVKATPVVTEKYKLKPLPFSVVTRSHSKVSKPKPV
ncbi:hypothetical protein GIB67_020169 [Kingdonia uniflora]|uniref:Uncharacterized protein n=1 Tax=Kingdonia uniflora TaxID=39325 RepID=A0A7J7NTS7_9MAGN|nr:hypothetical protein GIB67_020169 [Kingdonia uniflora]